MTTLIQVIMYNKCRESSRDRLIHSSSQGRQNTLGSNLSKCFAHLLCLNEAGKDATQPPKDGNRKIWTTEEICSMQNLKDY